jgi:uncharacterized membrane protein YhaH (DUF805 family)
MTLRDKLFSFDGRLRRSDYWFISICMGLSIFVVTEIVMLLVFGPDYSIFTGGLDAPERRATAGWPYIVQALINTAGIWPNMAISAKRAHDRDKSARTVLTILAGIWVLNYTQLPILNAAAGMVDTTPGLVGYMVVNLIVLAACIYLFVVVGCLDGTHGPNRFGPSPKADDLAEAV